MNKMKWFKTVFFRPFVLILVVVSFLGILTTGIITSRVMRNIINENVIGITYREKVIQSIEIDAWFGNAIQTLNNLAGLLPMMPPNWFEPVLVHFTETYDFINNIFIGFPDGETINGLGWVPDEDWSLFDRPWYIAALESEPMEISILDAFWSHSGQTYTSAISIRIPEVRVDDLEDVGIVLGFSITLDHMISRISEMQEQMAEGGYLLLIGSGGQIITHSCLDNDDLPSFAESVTGQFILRTIEQGNEVISFTDDNLGRAYLITTPVESLGWTLAAVVPTSYLDSIVTDHLDVIWLAFAVFVIVSLGAVIAVNIRFSSIAANQRKQLMARERQLYDANPIPATLWNSNKELIECNNAMYEFFGLSSKEELMSRFFEFSPEYQPCGTLTSQKITVAHQLVIENGFTKMKWMHVMPQTGEQISTEITMVRIDIDDGDYLLAAYLHDLRESEAAMEKFRQAKLAEQESKAKSRFLAQVSHEIRTPLNAIIGVTEIQLQTTDKDSELEDGLIRIHNSSHMLLALINNLLDLSKVEANKMEIIDRPYDLMSLLHDVAQMNTIYIGSKQINFDLQIDPQLPAQLIGDSLRVKQACNNILSNAFKYTEEGTVTLRACGESSANNEDTILVVSIKDTGKGMTEEQVKVLFSEEYIRFDEEENTEIQGTGLGMAITYKLMHMMKGSIDVQSELGKGTNVTLRIPQKNAGSKVIGKEAAESLQSFETSSVASKKMKLRDVNYEPMPYGKVLVVDDTETNLYVAKGLLSPYKLEIDTATSGREVIDKINDGKTYDIIFMDHMMPEMDGIETVEKLREIGYKMPIVALTANALVGQHEVFLQNGFQGFISKPIDMRHLNTYLERFVRNKKPPEVVNAARREAQMFVNSDNQVPTQTQEGAEVASLDSWKAPFLRDAARAVTMLESIMARNSFDADDLRAFTTQVHSMKSALLAIGEAAMSEFASTLEDAGRKADTVLIKSQAQQFITSLKAIIEKLSIPVVNSVEHASSEDLDFLREQLEVIKTSCESYEINTANNAINAIKQKPYPQNILENIDEINILLLRGDYEEAIEMTQKASEELA